MIVDKVDKATNYKYSKDNKIKIDVNKAINDAVNEVKEDETLIHNYAIPTVYDIRDHLIRGTKFGSFRSKSFPTAEDYLRNVGALDWFLNDKNQFILNLKFYGKKVKRIIVKSNCKNFEVTNLRLRTRLFFSNLFQDRLVGLFSNTWMIIDRNIFIETVSSNMPILGMVEFYC